MSTSTLATMRKWKNLNILYRILFRIYRAFHKPLALDSSLSGFFMASGSRPKIPVSHACGHCYLPPHYFRAHVLFLLRFPRQIGTATSLLMGIIGNAQESKNKAVDMVYLFVDLQSLLHDFFCL